MRPSFVEGNKTFFDFAGNPVYLVAIENEGVHWVDIFMRLTGIRADRLDWARKLLKDNREMASATPIPSWFAIDNEGRVVFVNRLDWRHTSAEVLEDHIRRATDEMRKALIEDGVGNILAQRHHRPTQNQQGRIG